MTGLSGLDRKAMELERLARVARKHQEQMVGDKSLKRKTRPDSPMSQSIGILTKKSRSGTLDASCSLNTTRPNLLSTSVEINNAKASSLPLSVITDSDKPHSSSQLSLKKETKSSRVQYPDGVVKRTWARGFPRHDDITIEEILQKDDLTIAVLSTFQIDPEWIIGKLAPQTRVYWVLQAKTEDERRNWESRASSNYKFCFPSMKGNVNCMHSKLQLLAHPSHLRIVIPTANLVPYDWGETGVMENMCFIIDLPRHKNEQSTSWEDLTHFGKELLHFLNAKGIPGSIIKSIRKFDFARTAKIGFVHSIGGSHVGASSKRTGYCGLASTINILGLQNKDPINIDFITASMGNINPKFIRSLYMAAQGQEMNLGSCQSRATASAESEKELQRRVNDSCRVYFPTRETIEKSLGGLAAGGTICFQSKWWSKNHFLQNIVRDCLSRREGMLMHSKMWFVRPKVSSLERQSWAYIGSANLSESAWGRLVIDKKTKQPKINCANWECGVILPVSSDCRPDQTEEGISGGIEIFEGHVPIPMVVPGASYAGREPWFFNESK